MEKAVPTAPTGWINVESAIEKYGGVDTLFTWSGLQKPILPREVRKMKDRVPMISEPYSEGGYLAGKTNRNWHIGRVLYLAAQDPIAPIVIKQGKNGEGRIADGHHRLLSRAYRGDKFIQACYEGED